LPITITVFILTEFISFRCAKLVGIYICPSNTTNLLHATLHATCFGRSRPYSIIQVRNLKTKWPIIIIIIIIIIITTTTSSSSSSSSSSSNESGKCTVLDGSHAVSAPIAGKEG
jgi:hypothetical protein